MSEELELTDETPPPLPALGGHEEFMAEARVKQAAYREKRIAWRALHPHLSVAKADE